MTTAEKAGALRALHRPGQPLVLVNAWDCASARIVESLGFPAVATTSAGVAWRDGYPDGERISREEMLHAVERIASSVSVPVTADMERGYGTTREAMALTAEGTIAAGAVGLNFEDWLDESATLADCDAQCDLITALAQAGKRRGVDLVINARTDVYLQSVYDDERTSFDEAVRRANAYLAAGAACAFIPGVTNGELIRRLVENIEGPVSVLANAQAPSVAELATLGVSRISIGGASTGVAMGAFERFAAAVRDTGSFAGIAERISHARLNELFTAAK